MTPSTGSRLFGTDGIRGLANRGPLSAANVLSLGEVTARWLARTRKRPGRVGLGWDTRQSSPLLASALTAGLSSGGSTVYAFGVMPTPAVSLLTRAYGLDAGIVISASHNPAADNGIKYFSDSGRKFPDAGERALEKALRLKKPVPVGEGVFVGTIRPLAAEAVRNYTGFVHRRFNRSGLSGLRVVADLANGATCRTVPPVLEALGVRARFVADRPDGLNINAGCGSLHPENVARRVKSLGADAGLALDGDGDRVILVDERGRVINGDRILGMLARHYAGRRRLLRRRVVATVMSNLGLELYLKQQGITLLRAPVGDRFVAQVMARRGAVLGGEQSGHLLLPRALPTGDGLWTALEVLSVLVAAGKPLSELAGGWEDFPQILVNVPVTHRPEWTRLPRVGDAVRAAQHALGDRGRVNLRYSGTEPLARVMVEAQTRALAWEWAERISDAVSASIGSSQRRFHTWLTCA